jgi:hypothetical protein
MDISQKTEDTLIELNEFSGSKIKNTLDLSYLIEIAEKSGKDKLFYDIQFTAKYLNGLAKIMQSSISQTTSTKSNEPIPSPEQAKEKIMAEYKKNVIKFTAYLKDLLLEADKEVKTDIEERYLALNRTSMVNLTSLIYDLSWLKKYNNSKRD